MSTLVFGRSGQVARELQRQGEVTALGRDQADLEDPRACYDVILSHRPSVVINAAAWTAVDAAEASEAAARVVNAEAPAEMARACRELGIPFLHISTDYVFDGTGTTPWTEDSRMDPLNAYGRTKAAGEAAIAAAGGQWAILRTAWVFSAHGQNFVKTMLRLAETRDALTVVEDQIGCPTPAADIAAALLTMARAMRAGQVGGIYHFAGQPAISWAEFARAIFRQAGKGVTVSGIPSSAYPTAAKRPGNSRLNCARLQRDFGIAAPDWSAGLSRVIKELEVKT